MKYQFRNSIEDLYHFSTQTKDVAKCKNLDDFIKLASSFGDNDIQGKVFGENFYDFLFLEAGSTFDVAGVRPATEDQDVKENIDAFLKHGRKWLPAQYKFMADKFAPLQPKYLEGIKNVTNRGDYLAKDIVLVANCVEAKLPKQIENFAWIKITYEQFEHICSPTFFKRFADWIKQGKTTFEAKRKKVLKNYKPKTPYIHQEEMRADNHKQFLTNMVFQGAGKTDDEAEAILKGYELNKGSNAFHIFPFLGLADQNVYEVVIALKKRYNNQVKILNFSSALTWKIEEEGFTVENLSWKDDKWIEYFNDPNTYTYIIGTYAGLPTYVRNIKKNKAQADFYFDEAASLVPGQQVHTLHGLETESLLTTAFVDLVKYQHKTGGRMHYYEAVNLYSHDPKGIAFGNKNYFGEYAGKGPYNLQYGIDNCIIADLEVIIVEYDNNKIREQFPKFKEGDSNIIDAYCLSSFNQYLQDITGYYKSIAYIQTARECEPLSSIMRSHRPNDFFGAIVGETKVSERQKRLKAFGKQGINASLLNYMCLTLGISENSANGVYMSRNMNERLLSHAINRGTRRNPKDKPYQELVHKPKGYVAFAVDVNDPASLLQSEMFKQQMFKMVVMGLSPTITVIDGQSRAKDEDTVKKNKFVYESVASLTGNETLRKGIEELIEKTKLDIDRSGLRLYNNTIKQANNFDDKLAILEKAL
jgi:hypothetical protein|tara:strand:- start:181 stop:2280 length:2100 start_codon:yes stop_codon:yes gene_type:complete